MVLRKYNRDLLKSIAIITILLLTPLGCMHHNSSSTTTQFKEVASSPQYTTTLQASKTETENIGNGFACFASDYGVTCLNDTGWQNYTEVNSILQINRIRDMVACHDGKIYGAMINGLAVFDGNNWSVLHVPEDRQVYNIACDDGGSIWITCPRCIGRYQNGTWTMYESSEFTSGSVYSDNMRGIAIAPDGIVWIATGDSIVEYDGSSWKEYRQGNGFQDILNFQLIAVDSKGRTWACSDSYLYWFENNEWKREPIASGKLEFSMTTDPQNRVWLNTNVGSSIYDGFKWDSISYKAGKNHANEIRDVAFDGSGRTWLAMTYGIDVVSGISWIHYRMDNADLVDNKINYIAVVGDGPILPLRISKNTGSINGEIILDHERVKNAILELCVEFPETGRSGDPCKGQPFVIRASTNENGKFTVGDLPSGYYYLTFTLDNIHWFNIGRRVILEGQETNTGEINVQRMETK